MKKCNDVMTKDPVCCLPEDTVVKAAQLMKNKDIGCIPIIENENARSLIGIVTDRDLALAIVAEGRNPKHTTLKDVMTDTIVSCRAEDNLQEVMDVMSDYQLRRMPVVDYENRIIGIVTQADVATRTDQPERTAEVIKGISQPNVIILER